MRHPDSGFVAGLDREQRVRYYEWWRMYLVLRRAASGFGAATIVFWILLVFPSALSPLAAALWQPAFVASLFFALWVALLDCPRCGAKFNGWFGRSEAESYIGEECQNCGLRKAQLSSIAKP